MTCLMRCIRLVGPFALAGVSVLPAQDDVRIAGAAKHAEENASARPPTESPSS